MKLSAIHNVVLMFVTFQI